MQGKPLIKDPKYDNKAILFLFFIFKLLRVYFVSWGYYFTPITAMFLNLYINLA